MFQLFVGEIGIDRNTFFHDLRWWEVRAIIRGYNARHQNMWSAVRWQTYKLMEAQGGTEHLRKNGINNPTDLIKFPWDKEQVPQLSDEECDEMQAEMKAINAAAKQKDESQ